MLLRNARPPAVFLRGQHGIADGEDGGVDEGVADPGGGERVASVVEPGPECTADDDGKRKEPGEGREPAEIELKDEDMVGGEADAADGDGG